MGIQNIHDIINPITELLEKAGKIHTSLID